MAILHIIYLQSIIWVTSLLLGDMGHLSYTVLDDIQDIDASSFRNATRATVEKGNSLGYDLDNHMCSVC